MDDKEIQQPIEPKGGPQTIATVGEILQHWFIMSVLWGLLYFEIKFINEIFDRWSDPFYVSNLFTYGGRLSEMIAFALSLIMALYTIGITLFILALLIVKKFKGIDYSKFIRLNTLVITSFIVYWAIFVSIFVRP